MKLYLIRGSFDPKVIGRVEVTQSAGMTEGYNYAADNSVYNISGNDFSGNDFLRVNFEKIKLKPKAVFTDYISSMAISYYSVLILSKSFFDYLQQYNTPLIYNKKVKIIQPVSNIELEYQAFFLENQYENIDYGTSVFSTRKIKEDWSSGEAIKFNNESALRSFIKELTWETSFKAVDLKIMTAPDIFRLSQFGGYLVSERLKEAIEEEGFSGIRFEPAENIMLL